MSAPTPILQRLQTHTTRIQRMLTPGLKHPGGRRLSLSPVLPGFGGSKYKQGLASIHFLDKKRLGSLRPDSINLLNRTLPARFKNPRALLHLQLHGQTGSDLWPEVERAYPIQSAASETEARPEPGVLRQGSIIQKLQSVPQPGQTLDSFREQVQGRAKAASPEKPRRSAPLAPNARLYSRVEEVTGRRREPSDTPEEQTTLPSPEVPPGTQTPSPADQTSQQTQPTAPTSRGGDTVQRIPEKRPGELSAAPRTQPESKPAERPLPPHAQAVPQADSAEATFPAPSLPTTPSAAQSPEQEEEALPHAIPVARTESATAIEKPILKALPVRERSSRHKEAEPARALLKAMPAASQTFETSATSPAASTARAVPAPPVTRVSPPSSPLQPAAAFIQRKTDVPTSAKPAVTQEPEASRPRAEAEGTELPEETGKSQQNFFKARATREPDSKSTARSIEADQPLSENKGTLDRQEVLKSQTTSPSTSAPAGESEIIRSVSPTPPLPLQKRLEYRKLAPATVRQTKERPIQSFHNQPPVLKRRPLLPGPKSTRPQPTAPQMPIARPFSSRQPEPEVSALPSMDPHAARSLEQKPASQTASPEPNRNAQVVAPAANQAAATGLVQRIVDRVSSSPPGVVRREVTDPQSVPESGNVDLDQLAESLLPLVKRILETESERSFGWLRSSRR